MSLDAPVNSNPLSSLLGCPRKRTQCHPISLLHSSTFCPLNQFSVSTGETLEKQRLSSDLYEPFFLTVAISVFAIM